MARCLIAVLASELNLRHGLFSPSNPRLIKHMWIIFVLLPIVLGILFAILTIGCEATQPSSRALPSPTVPAALPLFSYVLPLRSCASALPCASPIAPSALG